MSSELRVVCRQVFLNMVHEFCSRVRTRGNAPHLRIHSREGQQRPVRKRTGRTGDGRDNDLVTGRDNDLVTDGT